MDSFRRLVRWATFFAIAGTIVTLLVLGRTRELHWMEDVQLHDGRVVAARREALGNWDPVLRLLDQRPRGAGTREHVFRFPLDGREVVWRANDAGFGGTSEAMPVLFDVRDGVPFVVVPIPRGPSAPALCERFGWPVSGAVVFAWRDGAWARVGEEFVPFDYRLNVYPHRMPAMFPSTDYQATYTLADKAGHGYPERGAPQTPFGDYALRAESVCGGRGATSLPQARVHRLLDTDLPVGAPIVAVRDEAVPRDRSSPSMSLPEFDARYPGRDAAGWAQSGCVLPITTVPTGSTVAPRNTRYVVRRDDDGIDVLDVPPLPMHVVAGFACEATRLHVLLLPKPAGREDVPARLFTLTPAGEPVDVRDVVVAGIRDLKPDDGQRFVPASRRRDIPFRPVVIEFRRDGAALVLTVRDEAPASAQEVSRGGTHTYRIPLDVAPSIAEDSAPR